MPVHVSIHDVSPAWSDEVLCALALCAAAGARPALLVVPDFHGRSPLLGDAAFCERLRQLQAAGHEIYLHGLVHMAPPARVGPALRERIQWTLAQRAFSAGEAELAHLEEGEGHRRIAEGERVLRGAGLRIDGYVAPAWVMPGWLLPALSTRGIRYTEGRLRIYDVGSGRSRASLVMNWATRSGARLLASAAWCRLARPARPLLPMRIAIHPGDMRSRMVEREVRTTLAWASGDFVERGIDLLDRAPGA
jgi:predicted deacetylase